MCGIFGYTGKKPANDLVFQGLKRLEYRGYDSFGFSILNKNEPFLFKKVGKISEFEQNFPNPLGEIGIAHTRWATTGEVTEANSHPHFDCQKTFF